MNDIHTYMPSPITPLCQAADALSTTVAVSYTAGSGTLQVVSTTGFPAPSTGSPLRITALRASDRVRVHFKVTAMSGNSLTVTATDGYADINLHVGDRVGCFISAEYITDLNNLVTYTNSTPTPVTIDGVPAGTTFANNSMTQILDLLLYPYQSPSFSSYAISGQSTTVEVGTTISGSQTFTWGTANSGNITANSITIQDATTSTVLGASLANNGTHALNVGTVQRTSQGTHTWSITGTNSQSSTFSANFSVAWDWRNYYGTSVSATLSGSGVAALASSLLTTGYANTYSYAGGGYKYLCYPATTSAAVSFKDASNNLNVAMADSSDDASYSNVANGNSYALVSVTNSLSQTTSYRVYRTKNVLGGALNILVA